jgi:hypothetical protein
MPIEGTKKEKKNQKRKPIESLKSVIVFNTDMRRKEADTGERIA